MTVSDEYIKMVLALPEEFFENWKWKAGEQFIDIKDHDTGYIGQYIVEKNTVKGLWNEGTYELENDIKPLPNQEQLQELILNYLCKTYPDAKTYDIINFFCDWFKANFSRNPKYKEVEYESGSCIWLRYVLHVIYSKTWNGNQWI